MAAQSLDIIDDPARARAALQPIRLRLLHLLERPQSAPQLAKAMGMPRQRVLYHLRKLEAQRLVDAHDHGSVAAASIAPTSAPRHRTPSRQRRWGESPSIRVLSPTPSHLPTSRPWRAGR